MDNNVWTANPMTEQWLVEKGERWRNIGRRLILIGLCGFALFILTLLIALLFFGFQDFIYVLTLNTEITIAILFAAIGYLSVPCLMVGAVVYLKGIHFWSLGKIALNTQQNSNSKN